MDYQSAEIVSLYKHTIKYKRNIKSKKILKMFVLCFVLIIPLCGLAIGKYAQTSYYNSIMEIFSPTAYFPYGSDEITFTYANQLFSDKETKFELPIKSDYKIIDNVIEFKSVPATIVTTIEKGVVADVGTTLDGTKYIKIIHPNNVISTIENIDVSAVVKGQILNSNTKIATAKQNSDVKLIIEQDNLPVTNIEVTGNEITWQK